MTKKTQKQKDADWRKGYDQGVEDALKSNDKLLRLGAAVLDIFDILWSKD